ncbi:hypothetical protein N7468_009019 [Penicillium chermesinum]|uniref:Casein kinase substrate phosphoprotein PP28 domain-containing protein n=1 Tax=Penicillium chermesinum TaxID=63820 RepID=A0A9W9TFQ7_9EURO|nr:uncharacterized protein N7468_009019 [Penicillium chermesinum]KAJ5219815.1 hypothetical protein N7468_009019 [Penicillium chermesinum]KAJ6153808.1 hypothetical protein N7470_006767 [Penicillium chermesinum]
MPPAAEEENSSPREEVWSRAPHDKQPRKLTTSPGGKHFSRDIIPTDKDGNVVGLWRVSSMAGFLLTPRSRLTLPLQDPGDQIESSSEEESSEEESSSEESEDAEAGLSTTAANEAADQTREARRAAAKAKKQAAIAKRNRLAAQPGDLPPSDDEEEEDETDLPANPNHTAKSRSQLEKKDDEEQPKKKKAQDISQLSRREREAIEAQQARERYLKLHAEGKTEEAQSDLARLALVREQREAERARKQAEKEEKEEQAKQKAAAIKEREERARASKQKKGGKKK